MAYPQPDANQYAIKGYPFFRLQTPLVSPGDIYESEQGALALALGPESDVARATVYYYDDQLATRMNAVDISQDRLLAGKIFARNDALYIPSQRKGRILIAVDNLYDPLWRPRSFSVDNDAIEFVNPILDVLQYFSDPPNIAPQRADKRYLFQDFDFIPGDGSFYLVLPYWGRRYAYIQLQNASNTGDVATVSVLGVNYAITDDSVPVNAELFHQQTTLLPATNLAQGVHLTNPLIVTAGTQGMFDAIVISTDLQPMVLQAVFSDVEEA